MNIDRQRLTEIIESEKGINWWKPDLFEQKVRALLPSELEIISPPPEYEENYNCFVFAFGLQDNPEFLGGNNPVQPEFVENLISNSFLTPKKEISAGDYILYKNKQGNITHAGIAKDENTAISKWMWGPIIVHNLWDVPSSFGDEIISYGMPNAGLVREEYMKYKNTGVIIKPIE